VSFVWVDGDRQTLESTMTDTRDLPGPHTTRVVRETLLTAGAAAGALWCLFLAPIQSAVWNAAEPGPPPIAVTLMAAVIDVGGRSIRRSGRRSA
jgi:hypothetical protein